MGGGRGGGEGRETVFVGCRGISGVLGACGGVSGGGFLESKSIIGVIGGMFLILCNVTSLGARSCNCPA